MVPGFSHFTLHDSPKDYQTHRARPVAVAVAVAPHFHRRTCVACLDYNRRSFFVFFRSDVRKKNSIRVTGASEVVLFFSGVTVRAGRGSAGLFYFFKEGSSIHVGAYRCAKKQL